MAQPPVAKKRAGPRFEFFADAEIALSDGKLVLGQVSELSAQGCCIATLGPIPIGAGVSLRLSDGANRCELPGKVIYANVGGVWGLFAIGVVFVEMNIDQRSMIDGWLRELAGRSIQRHS